MTVAPTTINSLPDEMLVSIASHLDLPEVSALANTSSRFSRIANENSIWRSIAEKIHCPLDPEQDDIKLQIKGFVEDLREITKSLPECNEEPFVKIPVNRIDEITFVIERLKARSIFLVWYELAQKIDEPVPQQACVQPGDVASEFSAWFAKHQVALSQLTTLTLSQKQLTYLPPEIGQLTGLQTLDLWDNKLTSLPPEIGQLTQLQELMLFSNKLPSLPPEFGQLTQLQKFDLSFNRLKSLPNEIGQLIQLQKLDLRYNELTSLPTDEIGKLTQLQELVLEGNRRLTSLPIDFPFELGQSTRLTQLQQMAKKAKVARVLTSPEPRAVSQIFRPTNLMRAYLQIHTGMNLTNARDTASSVALAVESIAVRHGISTFPLNNYFF